MELIKNVPNRIFKYIWTKLFPNADINIDTHYKKILEKPKPVFPYIPYIPYKRPRCEKPLIIKPLKKPKSKETNLKKESSVQTISTIKKKYLKKIEIPVTDLPIFKLKQKVLKILPDDSYTEKFAKIYEKYFSNMTFKSIEDVQEKTPERCINADKISIENISNVSDSFITPEESPILTAAPNPVINSTKLGSPILAPAPNPVINSTKLGSLILTPAPNPVPSLFNLESPLIHNVFSKPIEGWGLKSSNIQAFSPNFPQSSSEIVIKPVVLFSASEEKEKLIEMEILPNKDVSNNSNRDFFHDSQISAVLPMESVDTSTEFQVNNSIMNFTTDSNQFLTTSIIEKAKETNPFLDYNNIEKLKETNPLLSLNTIQKNEGNNSFLGYNTIGKPAENNPFLISNIGEKPKENNPFLSSNIAEKDKEANPFLSSNIPEKNKETNPFLNTNAAQTVQPIYKFGSQNPGSFQSQINFTNPFLNPNS